MVFLALGFSAALGLAAYLYYNNNNNNNNEQQPKNAKASAAGRKGGASKPTRTRTSTPSGKPADADAGAAAPKPKDIWKVGGDNGSSGLKKPKTAYTEKPFGSKYYYAHNDSKTTGGYKDGLKMEDYRMNGPRLLSVNGLAVTDNNNKKDDDDDNDVAASSSSTTAPPKQRITALDPNTKNVTKYLWDDPGNGKGIATIRVDVLPGDKLGEFVDWKDAGVVDVSASLPGEGLLAEIVVKDRPGEPDTSYRLKIDKLYGDAADVKVVLKPKRLLIKIYKKKHGFLSQNDNNLAAWPQPHRKL
eukprot:jgi/Psemu1/213715/e_gw1.654.21.1